MTFKEYLLWVVTAPLKRVKEIGFDYECVGHVKDFCKKVWGYSVGRFGGTAYQGWINRSKTFKGKKSISGKDWLTQKLSKNILPGSIVIFMPNVSLKRKKPGTARRFDTGFGSAGHVAVVDYIDNDGVIRVIEQNGGRCSGDGENDDAIRIWGYLAGPGDVARFILQ